jgi:hypothetical protein
MLMKHDAFLAATKVVLTKRTYMQTAQPLYSESCVESGVNKEPIEPPPDPLGVLGHGTIYNIKAAHDVVPVEREREYPKTFVSGSST